jgi:FAD/FMN-containing dehydrogenase
MGFTRQLAGIVGDEHVVTDQDVIGGYTTDWTGRYRGPARCVVRPGSVGEVAGVIRACGEAGVPVIPQGGNTSLVGASVPPAGAEGAAVVLSTRRLRRLDPVDGVAGQVTAGAGVTLAELQAHARRAGLSYGVDLAARDSATVGGTIATNAGGVHTIRYGFTRAQLLGVEAVLADASIISRLAGLAADNTGYDLAALLAGSEGTLGVITAARLRLWPPEEALITVLAGVEDIAAAAALCAEIRACGGLRAAEYIEADGVALVCEHAGLRRPLEREYPCYLLAETAGMDSAERLAQLPQLDEAAVADDAAGRAGLWAYRERHTEAISAAGIPHKLDVALPAGELAAFRTGLADAVRGHRAIVFGHIGAGNLHVNVLGPDPDDDSVDEAVLRLVAKHGGTISAEHGVGRAKARWLGLTRSAAEIAAMRAVKDALDPAGLLNPGVLL